MFKSLLLAVVIGGFALLPQAEAQHLPIADFYRDYCKQVPRQFSPDDPWIMGWFLRTEVGFGGLFFNCDGEAMKRYSPYITWGCQNVDCPKRLIKDPLLQQLAEVRRRVQWGACGGCAANCQCNGCQPAATNSCNCKGCQPSATNPCNCNGISQTLPQRDAILPPQASFQYQRTAANGTRPAFSGRQPVTSAQQKDQVALQQLLQQSRREKGLPYANRSAIAPANNPATNASRQSVTQLYEQVRGKQPTQVVRQTAPLNRPVPQLTYQPPKKSGFLSKILNPITPRSAKQDATINYRNSQQTTTANRVVPSTTTEASEIKAESGFRMLRR